MLRDEGKPIQGLQGIRILDFTWAGAGPFATEQLCRMGADVVKVEAASRPDLLRVANIAYNWGPGGLESNSCFNDMNAGKRSISLDLKSEAGQRLRCGSPNKPMLSRQHAPRKDGSVGTWL